MDLSSALATEKENQGHRTCPVARTLSALGPKDQKALKNYLADRGIQNTAISRALKSVGHSLTDDSIRRHRTGKCSCKTAS